MYLLEAVGRSVSCLRENDNSRFYASARSRKHVSVLSVHPAIPIARIRASAPSIVSAFVSFLGNVVPTCRLCPLSQRRICDLSVLDLPRSPSGCAPRWRGSGVCRTRLLSTPARRGPCWGMTAALIACALGCLVPPWSEPSQGMRP